MKTKAAHLPARLPTDFASLNRLLPLRPINDEIDLVNALEVMDRLAVLGTRTRDQDDYLQTLILLTEEFDKEDNAAAMTAAAKISGIEALRYLMQNNEMNQSALAKLLGVTASAASMILSGDRAITADHARTLGKKFAVSAGVFL